MQARGATGRMDDVQDAAAIDAKIDLACEMERKVIQGASRT
jgi:hypothetical protein